MKNKKCEDWEEELKREFELMDKLDEWYWQPGYPKLKNQLKKKIERILESEQAKWKQENSRSKDGFIY